MFLTIWNLINDCVFHKADVLDESELSELSDSLLSDSHHLKLAEDKTLVNFCCDMYIDNKQSCRLELDWFILVSLGRHRTSIICVDQTEM